MNQSWIEIDGSEGEGGGQMLRSALALSILTGKAVRLVQIRAKRSKPGLQAQHLACVQAASAICRAKVTGDALRSQTVSFQPGCVVAGEYTFKIGTAGATALVLHTVYLPLLLRGDGNSSVRIEGGTHTLAAPSGEYLTHTWLGYMKAIGAVLEVRVVRPGFFPKGGGLLEAMIQPLPVLHPLHVMDELKQDIHKVECLAIQGGGLPASIGERMIHQAKHRLNIDGPGSVVEYPRAKSPGVAMTLIDRRGSVPAVFFALGERGKLAERVSDEAVEAYLAHQRTGCPVDPCSADQLLLPLAFARGESRFRVSAVTQHLLTQRDVVQRFIHRRLEITGKPGEPGEVKISS